jgi:hypothetical protein
MPLSEAMGWLDRAGGGGDPMMDGIQSGAGQGASGEQAGPTELASAAGRRFELSCALLMKQQEIAINDIHPMHPMALFRYSVLSPLVSRVQLQRGELKAMLQELAARHCTRFS